MLAVVCTLLFFTQSNAMEVNNPVDVKIQELDLNSLQKTKKFITLEVPQDCPLNPGECLTLGHVFDKRILNYVPDDKKLTFIKGVLGLIIWTLPDSRTPESEQLEKSPLFFRNFEQPDALANKFRQMGFEEGEKTFKANQRLNAHSNTKKFRNYVAPLMWGFIGASIHYVVTKNSTDLKNIFMFIKKLVRIS
ncbi:MAG: hypothetical protein M1114_03015 [Candidatus Dependentiae bacterium]|nr:hypothetical protein [Candidatus Dependentiae bacterium]